MVNSMIGKMFPLLLAMLAVSACSGESKAPTPKVSQAQQPKTVVTATTATAQAEAEEIYNYVPAGRRDPFTPIVVKEEKKSLAGAKTPLERFPINEFKLSGIVWGGLGYHAMLEGPDGKGYFVRQGTVIGPNRGVVKKITPTSMIIEEKFKDPTGELNKKEIIIELRKPQEGTP
jgi:type IV pilus assembly protein PilP